MYVGMDGGIVGGGVKGAGGKVTDFERLPPNGSALSIGSFLSCCAILLGSFDEAIAGSFGVAWFANNVKMGELLGGNSAKLLHGSSKWPLGASSSG